MCFSKKILLVGAILGFVFIANTAKAEIYPHWQNLVKDDKKSYFWYEASLDYQGYSVENYPNDLLLNVYYATDTAGHFFWTNGTHLSGIYLGNPFTSQEPPTHNQDYHLWVAVDYYLSGTYLRYTSGGTKYINGCEFINDIVLAERTLKLLRCEGFNFTPLNKIILQIPYNGSYYFIVYSNEDLSYLNSSSALYSFLDILSNVNTFYTPTGQITLPAGTCDDLGTFAGALCRVITYLFQPTESALTQFSKLKDIIASKPPFGYFTSIKGYLSALSATSTPAFALTAEIGNISMFSTLKTGLTWILWLFFGFWVIKRIAKFDF